MKIYVVYKDTNEFGEVQGIYSSFEEAMRIRAECIKEDRYGKYPDDWSIEVWEVDKGFCERYRGEIL